MKTVLPICVLLLLSALLLLGACSTPQETSVNDSPDAIHWNAARANMLLYYTVHYEGSSGSWSYIDTAIVTASDSGRDTTVEQFVTRMLQNNTRISTIR